MLFQNEMRLNLYFTVVTLKSTTNKNQQHEIIYHIITNIMGILYTLKCILWSIIENLRVEISSAAQ